MSTTAAGPSAVGRSGSVSASTTESALAVEHRPLRLAMFSAVPPIPSGISAYLADLLPLLPEAWSVDVFTDEGVTARPEDLHRGSGKPAPCYPHTDFAARHAGEPYDLNVYQVGNTASRAYMLEYVAARPGLLVLHDGVLHASRIGAAMAAGDTAGYRRVALRCREDVGSAISHLVAAGLGGPSLYRTFPMCEDLVRASRATAMHGDLVCGWLRALVPGAAVVPLTHWRSAAFDPARRGEWRDRLSGDGEIVLGSFGNIGPERRLDRVLRALAAAGVSASWRLVVAGKGAGGIGLESLAAELGFEDRVTWLPGLDDADFVAVMAATDAAINLRFPPMRASSGVLHQLLQLGVPAIISDVVHWREYPEPAVQRVPPGPDTAEQETLRHALRRWIDHPSLLREACRAARSWATANLTPERMRSSYVDAIATAMRAEGER